MDDDWENFYFSSLSHAGTDDDDQDGYTDFWEYINSCLGLDSAGNAYEPNVWNQPGGLGYDGSGKKKNVWILFLPAILSGARHQGP
jgi:hypothetical protein